MLGRCSRLCRCRLVGQAKTPQATNCFVLGILVHQIGSEQPGRPTDPGVGDREARRRLDHRCCAAPSFRGFPQLHRPRLDRREDLLGLLLAERAQRERFRLHQGHKGEMYGCRLAALFLATGGGQDSQDDICALFIVEHCQEG